MFKGFFKKSDVVLFILLMALSVGLMFFVYRTGSAGERIEIKMAGKLYAVYSLTEDRTVTVEQDEGKKNIIRIEGGEVTMESSTCKNQVCVNHAAISRGGESIICLPNRVIVSIISSEGGESYDSVSG